MYKNLKKKGGNHMAFYQIETIEIRDKALVPIRLQYEGTIAYQSEHEVEGDKEVIDYTGKILGSDSTTHYLRLKTNDGTMLQLKKENILSVEQDSLVEAGSTIYFGNAAMVPPTLGKVSDVYISKKGDCYSKTDIGWKFQANICGPKGDKGDNGITPTVGENNNWFIDGIDTGVAATGPKGEQGETPRIEPVSNHWFIGDEDTGIVAIGQNGLDGADGVTPHINLPDKHWWIGNTDTGIIAEGKSGNTPYIGDNGNWFIGSTDTNIAASGASHMPAIDPISKHWFIDGTDTGVLAEGQDGASPIINPTNKHWMINGIDTGICAEGVGGSSSTIEIDSATLNWVIDGVDTNISAIGTQGIPGRDGKDGDSFQLYAIYTSEDEMDTAEATTPESSFVALVTDNDVKLYAKKHGFTPSDGDTESRTNFIWIKNLTDVVQIAGTPGRDGVTPHIDPITKHWMIGETDTGISAEPTLPFVGANGNWWVGTTDTNISASGTSGITPHIDPTTKHWMIGEVDTNVCAQASLPSINPSTVTWVIDGIDTGISAKGADGISPHIGNNRNWWIGEIDTNVSAVVDTDDINALKIRLNSLGASKHSMGEVDYFWCSNQLENDGTELFTVSGSDFNLVPYMAYREGNLETDDNFIILKPNRVYKLTGSLQNTTTTPINYFFKTSDNKKSSIGVSQKGEVSTIASGIISTGDSPVNVALYASVVDGSSDTATILSYSSFIAIEEICNPKDIDPVEYIVKEDGIEDTPVGTIISYMGDTPPSNYLACDGSIYNIDDYPDLTAHFVEVFGNAEHYGGDGITTFAVPDLRGEFLRGTGVNIHGNQGSGSAVGVHQDATELPISDTWQSSTSGKYYLRTAVDKLEAEYTCNAKKQDSFIPAKEFIQIHSNVTLNTDSWINDTIPGVVMTRPTNTSVLYCIKYKKTPFLQIGSDIKVSKEDDNQIVEKEDGIYVAPSDTTSLQQQVNKLSASKVLEVDSGYCLMSGHQDGVIKIDANSSMNFNGQLKIKLVANNIDFYNNSYPIIKKGRVYRITATVCSTDNTAYYKISLTNMITNNANSQQEARLYCGTGSYSWIIAPEEDSYVTLYIRAAALDTMIASGSSLLLIEEIHNPKVIDPVNYAIEEDGVEDVPVGVILSLLGTSIPNHYLVCDGTEYNIADYPQLAEHFRLSFGETNHYGGDGITTFAVPDLRGEFLRGAGTATRNTGSGAEVGKHQDPTSIPGIWTWADGTNQCIGAELTQNDHSEQHTNVDTKTQSKFYLNGSVGKMNTSPSNRSSPASFTTRPTNTAITWVIKSERTPFVHTGSIIYGTDIEISKDSGNGIVMKPDGLFVKDFQEPKVSDDENNALGIRPNGLYVAKEETYTDAEVEEAILAVFYPDRITTS